MLSLLLYIDPSSGGYLVQAIVAALLGAAYYLKTSWWRIRSFFGTKKEKQEDQEPQNH